MDSGKAKKIAVAWGPAILIMIAIFYLSAQSKLPEVPLIGRYDKVEHLIGYFTLGLFVLRGTLSFPVMPKVGRFSQTLLIGSLYGASDEFHQHFVPGRSMDVHDWLADVTGVLIALMLVSVYYRIVNGGKHRVG